MKKIFVLLFILSFVSETVNAQTCNGGTLVTSNTPDVEGCSETTCNGHTFCVSDKDMNWWSAHAWCRSNGRKLVSRHVACLNEVADCPNFNGVLRNLSVRKGVWLSTRRDNLGTAYAISKDTPLVFRAEWIHLTGVNALCE